MARRSGRFVGSADYRAAQTLFAPDSYAQQPRKNHKTSSVRRGAGPGKYRLFRGQGWGEVLAVPFYDLPGRICAFMFIGRDADPAAGDVVFKAANFQPAAVPFREAGVAMWAAMDEPKPERLFRGQNFLFLVSDPLLALQLQCHWFRENSRPLPIVAMYGDARVRTAAAVAHLPPKRLIFWGNNSQAFSLAKIARGEVSRYQVSAAEMQRNLAHHPPCDWLRLCADHAEPFSAAFRGLLRQCSASLAEKIFRELDFTPDDIRRLLPTLAEPLRERLQRIESLTLASRKVAVRGKTVVESDAGWTLEGSRELICNAAIRVEEILQTSENVTYYRGTLRLEGVEHSFTVPQAEVDRRGLFLVLRDLLLKRGAGLIRFQPRWSAHALFIALTLGQPKCRYGVDRIGWNPREYCFSFPQFSICRGGELLTDVPPLAIENPPAANFGRHLSNSLFADHIEALGANRPEVSILWAMAACLIHNLLAPAMHYPPAGILLDGPGRRGHRPGRRQGFRLPGARPAAAIER